MKKKKVVHYISNLINGGVEAMLLNYYDEIKDEFDFVVVIHENPAQTCVQKFEQSGIKIYQIEHWIRNPIQNFKQLYHILKKEEPDIFHTHHGVNNFIPCFAAKVAGVKVRIGHCHNYLPKKTLKQKMYSFLTRMLATDLAACGLGAGEYLTSKKMVQKGKVQIIYNAINLEKFQYHEDEREKIRRVNAWKKDETVYGNIGRFAHQKNQLFLIDVFEKIAEYDKKAKFVIIGGQGDLYSKIMNRIESSSIKEKIKVYKDLKETAAYYSAMDVFLLPSFFEGFAVVLIEAQAANLPCLLSDKITREYSSENVIYLPIVSAEEWAKKAIMLKNSYRDTVIRRELLEKFDISSSAQLMRKYYNQLIERRF